MAPKLKSKIMLDAASRLLYDNIHDFKTAAMHVESEIKRYDLRGDRFDAVPGMNGRTHHEMWLSMKTVSHFNLGTALELMLKLLLRINKVPKANIPGRRDGHYLSKLYAALPKEYQKQMESTYRACSRTLPELPTLFMFINTALPTPAPPPPYRPPDRGVATLKGFFEYLDEDAMLWRKRYSWETVNEGNWHHYLGDISVFEDLINRVMSDIERR